MVVVVELVEDGTVVVVVTMPSHWTDETTTLALVMSTGGKALVVPVTGIWTTKLPGVGAAPVGSDRWGR
jgi:hypothetical protein